MSKSDKKIINLKTNKKVIYDGKVGKKIINEGLCDTLYLINKSKKEGKKWFVITKEGCSYCSESKKLLLSKKQKFEALVLDNNNRDIIYNCIDKITNNYRYFPMIFLNCKFVGGYTDLLRSL